MNIPDSLLTIYTALPYLLKGSLVTIGLLSGTLSLGLLLGIPMAVMQVYASKYVSRAVSLYVWFFRGLPALVLLFLFYFGLFSLLGLNLSAFASAILVLGLRSSAYQSQIFRGSIQSIGWGQMLAAQAIGMSKLKAIWNIILPQAIRIAIPGWSNEYSILVKDTAVAYAIGVMEILTRGNFIVARTYQPIPIYLTCGVMFIILTYGGVRVLEIIERKVRIPGYMESGRES